MSAGPGMIYCVCDFSTLCPRKDSVRGGLGCGTQGAYCSNGSATVQTRLLSLSLELTLLHMQKNLFLLGFSLASVEP